MNHPSTHESLLERLADGGDPQAWQLFQERYAPLIRDYARRRGWQASDCDDVLQDVLLSLSSAMRGFRYDPARGRLRSYLRTVVLRALSRKSRQDAQRPRLGEVTEPSTDDDELWEGAWRRHHVRRAMQRLAHEFPETTVRAFHLYVLEEQPPLDVARDLGISVDSVYQAKSRVMRRLSDLVAEQVDAEG